MMAMRIHGLKQLARNFNVKRSLQSEQFGGYPE